MFLMVDHNFTLFKLIYVRASHRINKNALAAATAASLLHACLFFTKVQVVVALSLLANLVYIFGTITLFLGPGVWARLCSTLRGPGHHPLLSAWKLHPLAACCHDKPRHHDVGHCHQLMPALLRLRRGHSQKYLQLAAFCI